MLLSIIITIEKKIEAFSQYQNELKEFPHPWSKQGLQVLAQFRGIESGCHYAEAFQMIRAFD